MRPLPPDPEYDTGRGPYVLLALLILIAIVGAYLKFSATR